MQRDVTGHRFGWRRCSRWCRTDIFAATFAHITIYTTQRTFCATAGATPTRIAPHFTAAFAVRTFLRPGLYAYALHIPGCTTRHSACTTLRRSAAFCKTKRDATAPGGLYHAAWRRSVAVLPPLLLFRRRFARHPRFVTVGDTPAFLFSLRSRPKLLPFGRRSCTGDARVAARTAAAA